MMQTSGLVLSVTMLVATVTHCRLLEAQTVSAAGQSPSIAVRVAMAKSRTSIPKEVQAVVTIRNVGDHVIAESGDAEGYRLHVAGKTGEPPKTPWYQQLLAGTLTTTLPAFPRYIAPAGSVDRTYLLSAFYDLSVPGTYTVSLELRDESGIWHPTNTATFEMLASPQQ